MKALLTLCFGLMSLGLFAQNIVFDGDSNTRGEFIEKSGQWTGNTNNYPNQVMTMVDGFSKDNLGVNSAISSQIVNNMASRYPGVVNSNTIFSLFIGINDFGLYVPATEVFSNVKQILSYVNSLGCNRVVVSTYPPTDRVQRGSYRDLERVSYNQMLRDSAQFYNFKVADVAAEPEFSTVSTEYYADDIHWGIAGCAVVAQKVAEQINSFLGVSVPAKGTWLGTVSSDVSNPANWQGGSPNSSTNLFIRGGSPYLPEITGSLTCGNITLKAGVNVNITGTLKVSGTIIGTGTINATAGTIEFNNYWTPQVLFSSNFADRTIHNLSFNSNTTLVGNLNVTGTLNPVAGILNTNNNLTLKSTATGTARVSQGPASGGYISGNVTVERFVGSPSPRRAWRLLTTPLSSTSGTAVTVFDSWQLGGNMVAGQGTLITGPSANASANGLDAVSAHSLKVYDGANLVGVDNTKAAPLFGTESSAANKGYFIFVRGDRSSPNLGNVSSTTLSATGALQTGNQTFATSSNPGQLTLIGNPYASPVDFDLFRADNTGSNIKPNFIYWDPTIGGVGGFVTVTYDGVGSSYSITPAGANRSRYIQSGQAIFLETSNAGGNASVTFKESHKAATTVNSFRTGDQIEKLEMDLQVQNSDGSFNLVDGIVAKFGKNYSVNIDDEDAQKMMNVDENLGLMRNGYLLSVEGRPLIDYSDTMFLAMSNMKAGATYRFNIQPSAFNAPLLNAYLVDNYLRTSSPISLQSPVSVNFVVTSDPNSAMSNRFSVVFTSSTTLPVSITKVSAVSAGNSAVKVQWNVATETNISAYEVERSIDGTNFLKIGSVPAKNTNNSSYEFVDGAAKANLNYYRIKIIDNAGVAKYSSVVSVKVGNSTAHVSLFPNPATGKSVNVNFSNQEAGTYNLTVIDGVGKQVQSQSFTYQNGSITIPVKLNGQTPAGVYRVVITKDAFKVSLPLLVQ